jgi:peptidoglycan/LPS O-acetylase OafA/YrhL
MIATLERPVAPPRTLTTIPPTHPQAERRPATPKLPALTSLRFFAAAMIVMLHAQAYFGIVAPLRRFTLTQGVCFFFVLSGFILTYAYPSLDGRGVQRFLVSRLARIVPLHLATMLLYVLILPAWYRESVSSTTRGAGLLTAFLLQAWVPVYRVQTAFNGVSWSLSAEFFFYLCFPLLLWRWRQTWRVKLALTFLLAVGTIIVANRWLGHLPPGADVPDVVYFFPLARLWEFAIGVATAHLWRTLRARVRCGRLLGTALELLTVAMALIVMILSGGWARWAGHFSFVGKGGEAWLASSGPVCLAYAALICVMACEWGGVSRLLSRRPFVLLGEISFSLYLLHMLFCHYYVIHPGLFISVPPWLLFGGYWLVVLLASYVGWAIIEVPCRRALVSLWDRHRGHAAARASAATQPRRPAERPRGRFAALPRIAASGALLGVVVSLHVAASPSPPVQSVVASATPVAGQALIAVETIGDGAVSANDPVVIERRSYSSGATTVIGWSVDPVDQQPVRGVLLDIDGASAGWADYGSTRNDVSANLGSAAYLHSGYIGMIPLDRLANGPHLLTVRAINRDGSTGAAEWVAFVVT